ncbi:spore gernimation protein [Sporosarcina sp. PTS2304]|uniref:GerAB/ArcD/ProY family transporter n=1 Tax=Sporosarcina sp. PTS2304 TaxID=2283194 RepID=UPI000E0D799A|nr:endospore germination permease [Sporosarcina sp. PTS2304]AXI00448.1 spore gernimation protein [Sporosarcina sp. PTS2304]
MKNSNSISVLHVIFLSMTVIGLKNHVTIIPSLLQDAGRDGWMSVLLATTVILPWLFLVLYIHKRSQRIHLGDWLTSVIGKVPSAIVRYTTSAFLLILAVFTMTETLEWINATFLSKTPIILLLVVYSLLCILVVTTNLQTIVIMNALVLFWVVILGFFVAFTNLQVKDYFLLMPFLEHGVLPVAKSAIYPGSGFVEIMLFLFIQHQVKDPFRWRHFAVMLFILVGLTIGPLIGAITEFGPNEASQQRYPAYEEWGLVAIGRYFEHLDFFSIYQWLTGGFIRISLLLYIAIDLLKITGNRKCIWQFIAPPFLFLSLSLLLLSDHLFLKIKGDYLLIITFFFLFTLTLFFGLVAFVSSRSSKKKR